VYRHNSNKTVVLKQVLLSIAVVKIKNRSSRFVEGRTLLDNGFQSNFMSQKFRSKLGLSGEKTQIRIREINQEISDALKVIDLNMVFDSYYIDFSIT